MANDRILITHAAMQQAIGKYQNARNELQDAYDNIDNARKHLDNCYKGPAYVALSAKLLDIYLNVKTAEIGINESIRGLQQNLQIWADAESNVGQVAGSRETGYTPSL